MSDPFHEDPLIYMKTMFTDDLRFMDRMIKDKLRLQKQKLIGKFIADLKEFRRTHSVHLDLVDIINKWEEREEVMTLSKECKECEVKGMCKLLLSKRFRFPTSNCKISIKRAFKEMKEDLEEEE